MTPGSLLLGNEGACFECGHQHSRGDRCLAFHFSPEVFESDRFRRAGSQAPGAGGTAAAARSVRACGRLRLRKHCEKRGSSADEFRELALRLAGAVCAALNDEPLGSPDARRRRGTSAESLSASAPHRGATGSAALARYAGGRGGGQPVPFSSHLRAGRRRHAGTVHVEYALASRGGEAAPLQ